MMCKHLRYCELQHELKQRGLPAMGPRYGDRKATLVQRLTDHILGSPAASPSQPGPKCFLARVMRTYTATKSDELTIKKDETVKVVACGNDDWCQGLNQRGIGLFPQKHVEMILQPINSTTDDDFIDDDDNTVAHLGLKLSYLRSVLPVLKRSPKGARQSIAE